MNKNQFWEIIESVKHLYENPNKHTSALKEALKNLTEEEIISFHDHFNDYRVENSVLHSSLNAIGNGEAGTVWYSDDGYWFSFVPWLIGRGKDDYLLAMKRPGLIARILPEKYLNKRAGNEGLIYAAEEVYKEKFGHEMEDRSDRDHKRLYGHVPEPFVNLAKTIIKRVADNRSEFHLAAMLFALFNEMHKRNYPLADFIKYIEEQSSAVIAKVKGE